VLQKSVGAEYFKWWAVKKCARGRTAHNPGQIRLSMNLVDLVLRLPRRPQKEAGIRLAAQIKRIMTSALGLHARCGIPNGGKYMRVEGSPEHGLVGPGGLRGPLKKGTAGKQELSLSAASKP